MQEHQNSKGDRWLLKPSFGKNGTLLRKYATRIKHILCCCTSETQRGKQSDVSHTLHFHECFIDLPLLWVTSHQGFQGGEMGNERGRKVSGNTCSCTEKGNDADTCRQVKLLHTWYTDNKHAEKERRLCGQISTMLDVFRISKVGALLTWPSSFFCCKQSRQQTHYRTERTYEDKQGLRFISRYLSVPLTSLTACLQKQVWNKGRGRGPHSWK